MNQNILMRLEKKAEKLVLDIPASLDCDEYTPLFNEKFAELIVQECIQVVDGMADPEEDSDRYVWALHNASEKIREHFGVE